NMDFDEIVDRLVDVATSLGQQPVCGPRRAGEGPEPASGLVQNLPDEDARELRGDLDSGRYQTPGQRLADTHAMTPHVVLRSAKSPKRQSKWLGGTDDTSQHRDGQHRPERGYLRPVPIEPPPSPWWFAAEDAGARDPVGAGGDMRRGTVRAPSRRRR